MKSIFTAIILFASLSARAHDDLLNLAGTWATPIHGEQFTINANGAILHSRYGEGDIIHISGDRYEVLFYRSSIRVPCQLLINKLGGTRNQVTVAPLYGMEESCLNTFRGEFTRTGSGSEFQRSPGKEPIKKVDDEAYH